MKLRIILKHLVHNCCNQFDIGSQVARRLMFLNLEQSVTAGSISGRNQYSVASPSIRLVGVCGVGPVDYKDFTDSSDKVTPVCLYTPPRASWENFAERWLHKKKVSSQPCQWIRRIG